jgi:hypothetical protein
LYLVTGVLLRFAAFVLDWVRLPQSVLVGKCDAVLSGTKLNDIRLPTESMTERMNPQSSGDPDTGPVLNATSVRLFVEYPAFRRLTILLPDLFQMNESPLPFAEQEVLQAGKREEIVFGIHRRCV